MVTELMPFSLFAVLYHMPNITLQMQQCMAIAVDICRALQYLHARSPQVIHRCATHVQPFNDLSQKSHQCQCACVAHTSVQHARA